MDSRVQDYLDDKLQSAADLETLDSLLASVNAQHELLRQQVCCVLSKQHNRSDVKIARRC